MDEAPLYGAHAVCFSLQHTHCIFLSSFLALLFVCVLLVIPSASKECLWLADSKWRFESSYRPIIKKLVSIYKNQEEWDGGEERSLQGFDGETWGNETAGKTQA